MVTVHKYMLVLFFFVSCVLNAHEIKVREYAKQFMGGSASAAVVLTSLVGIGYACTSDQEVMKTALTSYKGLAGQFLAGTFFTSYFCEKINGDKDKKDLIKKWGFNTAGYSLATLGILSLLRSGK